MSYVDGTAALRTNIAQDSAQRAQNARQFDSAMAMNMLQALMAQQRADADRGSEDKRHAATLQTQRDLNEQTLKAQAAIANRQMDLQQKDSILKEKLMVTALLKNDYSALDQESPRQARNWEDLLGLKAERDRQAGLRQAAMIGLKNDGTIADVTAKRQAELEKLHQETYQLLAQAANAQDTSQLFSSFASTNSIQSGDDINKGLEATGALGKGATTAGLKNAINLSYAFAEATDPAQKSALGEKLRLAVYGDGKSPGIGENGVFLLTQNLGNTITDLRALGGATAKKPQDVVTSEADRLMAGGDPKTLQTSVYNPMVAKNVEQLQKVYLAFESVAPQASGKAVRLAASTSALNRYMTGVNPETGINDEEVRKDFYQLLASGGPKEIDKWAQTMASIPGMDPRPKKYADLALSYIAKTRPAFASNETIGAYENPANQAEDEIFHQLTLRAQADDLRMEREHVLSVYNQTKATVAPFMDADPSKVEQYLLPMTQRLEAIDKKGREMGVDFSKPSVPLDVMQSKIEMERKRSELTANQIKKSYETAAKEAPIVQPLMPLPPAAPGQVPAMQPPAPARPAQPMSPEEFNRLPDAAVQPDPGNIFPQQGQKLVVPPIPYPQFGVGKM